MVERPPPVGGGVRAIEFDEGKLGDRALCEDRLPRGQGQVQRRQPAFREHEPRLGERHPEPLEAQEPIDAHRSPEIVVDHPQDDDLGLPGGHVASIAQVGLVDAVAVHAEVEHLKL